MGIQTIIKNVKKKRVLSKKSPSGTVRVPTTTGFITVKSDDPLAEGRPGYTGVGVGSKGGGGGGGGGSVETRTIDISSSARDSIAFSEKQRRLEAQRELLRKQAERVKREKLFAQQLRSMSASKRQKFFRDQARISKALKLQQLQERGVRLTKQSKLFMEEVQKEFSQRQATSKEKKVVDSGRNEDEKEFTGGFGTDTEKKIHLFMKNTFNRIRDSQKTQRLKSRSINVLASLRQKAKPFERVMDPVSNATTYLFDNVSGGLLEQREINKDREKLFGNIEDVMIY